MKAALFPLRLNELLGGALHLDSFLIFNCFLFFSLCYLLAFSFFQLFEFHFIRNRFCNGICENTRKKRKA